MPIAFPLESHRRDALQPVQHHHTSRSSAGCDHVCCNCRCKRARVAALSNRAAADTFRSDPRQHTARTKKARRCSCQTYLLSGCHQWLESIPARGLNQPLEPFCVPPPSPFSPLVLPRDLRSTQPTPLSPFPPLSLPSPQPVNLFILIANTPLLYIYIYCINNSSSSSSSLSAVRTHVRLESNNLRE